MLREQRRIVGFLAARLAELKLTNVPDPRQRRGKRFALDAMLRLWLAGMACGSKGLSEVEGLCRYLPGPLLRTLRLPGRVADTTQRDLLCRLSWQSLRHLLHRAVLAAHRRKALGVVGLPFGMVALDGKYVTLPDWSGPFVQRHKSERKSVPHGLLRTTTATLVTAPGKPCIDVSPIPKETNELRHFATAFTDLVRVFGHLFTLVSYDAGATNKKNGELVCKAGKHYLFRVADKRWRLYQLAKELLAAKDTATTVVEVREDKTEVRRTVRLCSVNDPRVLSFKRKAAIWKHTRTLVRVDVETINPGGTRSVDQKIYVSSMEPTALSPAQWIWATVGHWAVETTHQVLDVAFKEDDRPWIVADPNGTLNVLILRRLTYTLLTLYRSVTQRSDEKRRQPWKQLMGAIYHALITATAKVLEGLRRRDHDTPLPTNIYAGVD